MPAIQITTTDIVTRTLLHARQWHHRYNDEDGHPNTPKSGVSPAAIGVIVPIILLFFSAPFLCIFLVRYSRRRRVEPTTPSKIPTESREDARKALDGVAEVVTKPEKRIFAFKASDVEEACSDSMSVLEKDCAICLSSLHVPSPPEPAKVATKTAADLLNPSISKGASAISSTSDPEEDDILRLHVCGHEFHAACLISWHLTRPGCYICPICRATYYCKDAESIVDKDKDAERVGSRELCG